MTKTLKQDQAKWLLFRLTLLHSHATGSAVSGSLLRHKTNKSGKDNRELLKKRRGDQINLITNNIHSKKSFMMVGRHSDGRNDPLASAAIEE